MHQGGAVLVVVGGGADSYSVSRTFLALFSAESGGPRRPWGAMVYVAVSITCRITEQEVVRAAASAGPYHGGDERWP